MRFYAERPARAARQLLADVLAIGWLALAVTLAVVAHDVVLRLQAPARTLADAGDSMRGAFDGAARTAGGVPLVGDELARALGVGTDAGGSLARAGREQLDTIAAVATGTGLLVLLLGALPVLLVWLPLRLRYARAAGAAVARLAALELAALELAALGLRPPPARVRPADGLSP